MAVVFGLGLSLVGLGLAELAARREEGDLLEWGPFHLQLDNGAAESSRLEVVFDPPGMKYAMRVREPSDLERGWHEKQPIPPRNPGEKVVICIGDSLTYGVGVNAGETWPALLSQSLPNVRVYNFGVPGYDIEQVSSLLRSRIEAYHPDLLIWGAYTNDNMPTYLQYGVGSRLPVFVGNLVPPSAQILPDPIAIPLVHHSAFFRIFQGAVFAYRIQSADAIQPYPGWYEHYLDQIVGWTSIHSVPMVVLAMAPHVLADPATCPRSEKIPGFCTANLKTYRHMTRTFADLQLTWVDGLSALQQGGQPSYFAKNLADVDHPNAVGHALLAAAVLPAVQHALP
jgi:lysophospholipase L1-like esterase